MKNALVLFKTERCFREELEKRLKDIEIIFNECEETANIGTDVTAKTRIIIGNPPFDFLKNCPNLEWLQLKSAGADGYTSDILGKDVLLSCATGGYGHVVSEYMVALTFSLCKKLHLYRDDQHKASWFDRGKTLSIQGSTVVIIGMGDIGGAYAKRMKALGAHIIGVRRTGHFTPYADEVYPTDMLDDVLPRADIVALSLPGVRDTVNIINRDRLSKMKQGAFIINAGRGSAVELEALCDFLESGHLGGAALDVTDPEPLPQSHRLWKLENAVITPHVAGGTGGYMGEINSYILDLILENAELFMKKASLKSLVNHQTGYAATRI